MKYLSREIESSYLNLSFILYKKNLLEIIKNFNNLRSTDKELDRILSSGNIFKQSSNFNFRVLSLIRLLVIFNKKHTGYDKSIIRTFLSLLQEGNINKVIDLKLKKQSYIVYNFYTEQAIKYIKNATLDINERVLEYAGAFYYFSLLVILFAISQDKIQSLEYKRFCSISYEKLKLGILTGLEAYTEIETDISAGAVMEELLCLNSADERKLVITKNPEKETVEFKIKDNMVFQERYLVEGRIYSNLGYTEDIKKDRNLKDYFRIIKGRNPNSIKLIFKRASKQRTLGRILGFRETSKTHVYRLYESGMFCIKNMLIFCLLAILDNCNINNLKLSQYSALNQFIKNYKIKGKRYVAERIAVVVLIALNPELEEEIIKKYFKHTYQKEDILKDVKKLRKLLNKPKISSLEQFISTIRRGYVW